MTMTEAKAPERIFMATDLSTRCARAVARAALLARAWQSGLTVAHGVDAAEAASHDRLRSTAENLVHARGGCKLVVRAA